MKCIKKLLSIGLAFMLTFTYVYAFAAADEASDGYNLVPLTSDAAGVDTDSSFLLTVPSDITAAELEKNLILENEPPLLIEQSGELEFTVTPSVKLPSNSIITFRLSRDDDELSWMFQTADKFRITSTLPSDTATNIPASSGVEIEFSDEAYGDINFEIEPYAEGRFERHGKTLSFIPLSPLDYMTVYTVTVKAGTVNTYTNETIDEDLVFSFETEAEEQQESPIYIDFLSSYSIESSADDLTFELFVGGGEALNPEVSVYKFGLDAAMDYLKGADKYYRWSMYNSGSSIDTSGLDKLAAFEYKDICTDSSRVIKLPIKLSEGFYVVEAELDGQKTSTVVQISDLPTSIIGNSDGTNLVWVNDINTGKSCDGAALTLLGSGTEYYTDGSGIAKITNSELAEGFKVSANGRQFYLPSGFENEDYKTAEDDNLSVLRLDRRLYKKDDTVSFWGFVKAKTGAEVDCVTVALEKYGEVLSKQQIKADNGVYSGAFELPGLSVGGYNISVYIGCGEIESRNNLCSQWISVEDYVKPPYKIEISSDKNAVFDGDSINYTIKSSFFEGTPVADTEISYNWGSNVASEYKADSAVTDANGEIHLTQEVSANNHSENGYVTLDAEAALPEIGQTSARNSVRVFTSDIDVDIDAVRKDGKGTISAEVNSITLDRLNDGTAKDYYDYIDSPVGGKELTADIYRVYYTVEQIDTGYDYIEKKSYPIYKYNRNEEKIDTVKMTTGADGKANAKFSLSGGEYDSYYAYVQYTDRRGNEIRIKRYIGSDNFTHYTGMQSDEYYLSGAEDSYKISDNVNMSLMRGSSEVKNGSFLYVTVGGGIFEYSTESAYSRSFDESMAPDTSIYCYYFDGRKYQHSYMMRKNLKYAYDEKELNIDLAFDKQQYMPGDECTVKIKTTDLSGRPKSAAVCLSAVDNALFELDDYSADTAAQLYSYRYYSPAFTYISHSEYYSYRVAGGGGGANSSGIATADMAEAAVAGELGTTNGGDAAIRADFKDTAMFAAIKTDADGNAEYSFTLPDNITSWRLTASAVTDDLYAGDKTADFDVSKPMFVNYTLSDTFLIGDKPSVGVSVYGTELSGGDEVTLSVWREDIPDSIIYASSAAFERVNIPLPQMDEAGEYALIIRAESGGHTDTVRHKYNVYSTYRSVNRAVYAEAYPGMNFETADSGMSDIVFADKGRGQYLGELYGLSYTSGARIEKLAAAHGADGLIEKYFPDVYRDETKQSFEAKDYQKDDGGMAILPYADSDIELTVKVLPYVIDGVDKISLKEYLYNAYSGDNAENRFAALYGLAMMGEPILNDLDRYAEVKNLDLKDSIYLVLAYNAFGKDAKAAEVYSRDIAPNIVSAEPYAYINAGDSKDSVLELPALAMQTAAQLGLPESEGLYRYCTENYADDILINLEKLGYIQSAIENADSQDSAITYEYMGDVHTIELKGGSSFALRIPNKYMQYFKLTDVKGAVSTVSVLPTPVSLADADSEVTVKRRYYSANDTENSTYEFKQGDIVRVNVWIDYTNKAIDGSYHVTDYLPSGLEFVNNSAKIEPQNGNMYGGRYTHCKVNGQKIEFYDYNGRFDSGVLYYYYARVVSPGEYTAEGATVQNALAPDIFTVGQNDRITINE